MILSFGLLPILSSLPSAMAATGPFPDVEESHVNSEAIKILKDDGIIEGYPNGDYEPYSKINRAEFTKILVGAITDNPTGSNCFPDVHEEWFAPFVCEAKNRNIIEGYPDGTYKPAEEINFSEASKIIANTFDLEEGTTTSDPERWYKEFVTAMEAEKAIPLSIDFFDEDVTRDEMAEMIWRLKDEVDDKASRTYDEIYGEGFVTVDSCAELTERFELSEAYYPYMRDGLGAGFADDEMDFAVEAEEAAPAPMEGDAVTSNAKLAEPVTTGGGSGADDFSSTNVQVVGVDEADIIKNDGKYIYLIKGDTIRIVEAYPAENMEELVNISLGDEGEDFYPSQMYVEGDILVVIGSYYRSYPEPLMEEGMTYYPYNYQNRTKVYILDITDRSAPTVERTVEFDGNYSTSRRVGNTLYTVINQSAYIPYYYWEDDILSKDEVIVPMMSDSKYGGDMFVSSCSDIQILPKNRDFNFIITAAIPLDEPDTDVSRNVIVGRSENVYSSPSNMYVTATDWSGGYYRDTWDTAVYRFGLDGNNIEYASKGTVPGTVLNQFSMDEYDGYFRIATTEQGWGGVTLTTNNMYVLDVDDMSLVGDLENIAPGETIYSVRFMGEKAYMVTFQQIDPLFVIGLSDPTDPEILGELKIPGFSNYLHPYDENHLIGFGKEVDAGDSGMDDDDWFLWQQVQGIKVGIFDVTDVNNPKELYTTTIGDQGTYSELLYNHKALLFDKEKELLAFPISVYEYPDYEQCTENTYSDCPSSCRAICVPTSCTSSSGITVCTSDCDGENSCVQDEFVYGQKVFEGAYVYDINLEDGLTLKGKINHHNEDDLLDLSETGYVDYTKAIERILYIGENLYTVSNFGVKANAMDDLEELKMVELAGNIYDVFFGQELLI